MAHPYDLVTEKTKRMRIASSKVRDVANDAEPALASHREARTEAQRLQAVQPTVNPPVAVPSASVLSLPSRATPASSYKRSSRSIIDIDDDDNDTNNNDSDCDEIKSTNASSSDFAGGNLFRFLVHPITDG